jgi:hypothetical protein
VEMVVDASTGASVVVVVDALTGAFVVVVVVAVVVRVGWVVAVVVSVGWVVTVVGSTVEGAVVVSVALATLLSRAPLAVTVVLVPQLAIRAEMSVAEATPTAISRGAIALVSTTRSAAADATLLLFASTATRRFYRLSPQSDSGPGVRDLLETLRVDPDGQLSEAAEGIGQSHLLQRSCPNR